MSNFETIWDNLFISLACFTSWTVKKLREHKKLLTFWSFVQHTKPPDERTTLRQHVTITGFGRFWPARIKHYRCGYCTT